MRVLKKTPGDNLAPRSASTSGKRIGKYSDPKTGVSITCGLSEQNISRKSLIGINLFDGQSYQIAMRPTAKQDKVIPESFRIILRQYLGKREEKSLSPDGRPCTETTHGLLLRTKIIAGQLVPVGKETDRRWEQGEDASLVDFKVHEFRKDSNMVIADASDRKRREKIGVPHIMRKIRLSQKVVYAVLKGKAIRRQTMASFKRAMET